MYLKRAHTKANAYTDKVNEHTKKTKIMYNN